MGVIPTTPPASPFKCYLVEDAIRGDLLGGSYDNISAVTIACTAYRILQGYNPRTNIGVEIVDETGTAIAYIGRWFEEWGPVTKPAEEE